MNDLESVEGAIAALEAQRDLLGSAVVDTALAPLREQRAALIARGTAEQRKLVTVLFADLVDFTVISQSLDPEDTRAIEVERSTGRVSWYRFGPPSTWKRGF